MEYHPPIKIITQSKMTITIIKNCSKREGRLNSYSNQLPMEIFRRKTLKEEREVIGPTLDNPPLLKNRRVSLLNKD